MAEMGLAWALTNLLQYTNNSVNFLLYCLSGSRFREELWSMFRKNGRVAPLNFSHTRQSDVALSRSVENADARAHAHTHSRTHARTHAYIIIVEVSRID